MPVLGLQIIVPVSESMQPAISSGDFVLVQDRGFEEVQEGDIIAYSAQEVREPVISRVRDKNDTALRTRMDSNPGSLEFERHVSPSQLIGEALIILP